MRKPDDDLKIDISELFGGVLPSPSEKIEETDSAVGESPATQTSPPSSPEKEGEFQAWMNNRNAELDAQSQEIERKIQEQYSPTNQEATSENFSGTELLSSSPASENAPEALSASPIDFNAPIAPPFTGPPATPDSAPTAETTNPYAEEQIPSQNTEELKRLQADHEFLMLYDEFRNIIAYELRDLVGERKSFTMLGRTVELAREKYPEIFRNANWDAAGNLLEDGSVNSERIIENKSILDSQKADAAVDAALVTLLKLRLQAVEKGLGTGLKNKIRARLYQWISDKTQKATKEGKDVVSLNRLGGYLAST